MPTPTANRIESLQGKAGGIDLPVADGARFRRSMFVELLADRFGPADVGLDRRNIRRRRRGGVPKSVPEPDAAIPAVSTPLAERQDAGLSEQAPAAARRSVDAGEAE